MRPAFLFDMDGTIVDSLEDIGDSMNVVLAELGYPTHPIETYRTLVGDGARALVERALPADARSRTDDALSRYKARYRTHLVVKSRPYDGVVAMLEALAARGAALGVVTNKPHDAAVEIVERLFPTVRFAAVLGQKDGVPHKPDPTGPLSIARTLGVAPASTFFVGDTDTDMQTANNAGMIAVGVLWGFRGRDELERHGARHLVSAPHEIVALCAE
ncbi:MAG: HAD family hydrolase [Sandaracinaceae bacterium]